MGESRDVLCLDLWQTVLAGKRAKYYNSAPNMLTEALRPLKICLLSYRCNPHCGGQGVYLKNLSRALKDLGHQVDVIVGPPEPSLDNDIPVYQLPALDLYNPDDLFRMPSLKELSQPINLIEWLGVSTMGFPEPFTFVPEYNRTVEWADGNITSQSLLLFGRSSRDTGLESERDHLHPDAQRLYLLNSSDVHKKLSVSPILRRIYRRRL